MGQYFTLSANFRTGSSLPSVDDQYYDLWNFAGYLEMAGLPVENWFPPACSEANSLLNPAFTSACPTAAALAMAKADKENLASDLRTLGVWNGIEGAGGAAYTTTYSTSRIPSNLDFSVKDVIAFQDYRSAVKLVQSVVAIWNPMLVKIAPGGYSVHRVFPDRPAVGWMIYLPFEVTGQQVPEAAQLVPILDEQNKKCLGTLIVTTTDTFDIDNPAHIKLANAIETRLVAQDLLPTLREFVTRF